MVEEPQIEKESFLKNKKKVKQDPKQFGRVEIPQEAFIGVLKINKDS
jgi:GTP-binding protein LepA